MSTDEEILGRTNVDDLEAILTLCNSDVDEAIHVVVITGTESSISRTSRLLST